jgi:hypothetical protein
MMSDTGDTITVRYVGKLNFVASQNTRCSLKVYYMPQFINATMGWVRCVKRVYFIIGSNSGVDLSVPLAGARSCQLELSHSGWQLGRS